MGIDLSVSYKWLAQPFVAGNPDQKVDICCEYLSSCVLLVQSVQHLKPRSL